MRSIITHIAVSAFTLHIMLGCCWHHAHGADAEPGHVHSAQAYDHVHEHSHGGLSHFHGERRADDDSDESKPATPEPCSDPQCVYVHASKSPLPLCCQVAALPVIVSQTLPQLPLRISHRSLDDLGKYPPPVRRHVALEHFLN
ncbi:hypothetical protein NA78x_001313 [Anatilimnocola sp. NA78]|uniref:hypothetical protein n=1 Tax=Anatilimnocola sp. NA78 TaxID=3415683 RepID=UPI003CE46B25